MPVQQQAKVKSVLSGDTLILTAVNNPSQERTFSLAFVSAPRLHREGDEPYAFESRDFLRRACVGKVIQFQVLYSIPTGAKREYGIVSLQNGQQLPDLAVAEGWLKMRDDAARRTDESETTASLLDKLTALEARAKAESKGMWAEKGGIVETSHELNDPEAFLREWKGKNMDAILEKVITGDRIIARLILTPTQHTQTMVLIAGLRAPATGRTDPDGKTQPGEPFAHEAHQFVETRLLQRSVKVGIVGLSPQKQIVGHVLHPNGSIAELELRSGLARCADHHSTMLGTDMGKMRQAEQHARNSKAGIFQGVATNKSAPKNAQEATVSRVFSPDTLYLRMKSGEEKRVNLSSIRGPRLSDEKEKLFSDEAKEFCRSRLIGKHVHVQIDGKRPAQDNFPEREMATVSYNNKNVALMIVENGYASVIRHRMDDNDRSPIWDELSAAAEAAQAEKKGMYADAPRKAAQYEDFSADVQKARRIQSILSRQKRVPAIVDFVKAGSRFTVLIPKEKAKITFVLGGIRAPRSARNPEDKAEPFGQEAHELANRRCMQRDVEIDVEDMDKVGGIIGTLYINRESFAKVLVEEGLASVHAYSAERSGHAAELFAAEEKAKQERKGLWHDWDPSKEANGDEEAHENGVNGTNGEGAAAALRDKDYRDVVVSHIETSTETGLKLKLQLVGSGTAALEELTNSFRKFHMDKANATPLASPPKAGDVVAARFSEDDEWYRAKIRRNDREAKQAEVVYIDYGNSEVISWTRLRPLTQPQFGTQKVKAQAVDAAFSFCQFPSSPEYLREAAAFVQEVTADRQLVARVDFIASGEGTMHVTLFDPKISRHRDLGGFESINADVVAEGLAMVARKAKAWERGATEILKALKESEERAKEERKGMWEYGDLTED